MNKVQELQKILKPYEKVTIIGHDNIDVDAFLSGILLSNLLTFLKIKNEFVILQEIKEDDTYEIVKDLFNIDMKEYFGKEENSSRILFLEDHYKTIHEGKVIACIDHHPTSEEIKYPFYYSRLSCSTSYMVYELMKEAGYELSQEEAKMILVSMMVDTVSFRSAKTVHFETIVAKEIAAKYKLNYEEIEKYCLCLTPTEKMSINDIINNGYKYYNYNGNKVKSSYLQLYGMPEKDTINTWLEEIQKNVLNEFLEMWVFIVFECKNNKTYEYRIGAKYKAVVNHEGILSRGTNIMPKIEEMFGSK